MTREGSTSGGPSRRSPRPTGFEQEFPGSSQSANASVIALVRTCGNFMALTNRTMSPYGLSSAGRQALAVLEGAGGPLSPTQISQRLFVTTPSTTSLLDTLERRGLVTRLPDPDDRRKILVALTDAGQRVVDEFLPQVVALQTAALARLSESERAQLLHCLTVIQETVAGLDGEKVAAAAPPRSRPLKR
ncbi:MAG: MarR family winged helix-turn-helix transcriptional regulator [Candidatus Nanopelagicales bacterium]